MNAVATTAHPAETVRATIEFENLMGNHIERRPRVWSEDTHPAVRAWASRIAPTFWELSARALDAAKANLTTELVQDAADLVAAATYLDDLAARN